MFQSRRLAVPISLITVVCFLFAVEPVAAESHTNGWANVGGAPHAHESSGVLALRWGSRDYVDVKGGISLVSVSCPTTAFCVAVDNEGYEVTYRHGRWTHGTKVGLHDSMNAVSCASTAFCVAVDDAGFAYTYSSGRWSTGREVDALSNAGGLDDVSCPVAGFCMAVDGMGNEFSLHDGVWTRGERYTDIHSVASVSCASTIFCVAVSATNASYAYTYDNGVWSGGRQLTFDGNDAAAGGALSSVSCATRNFCLAVSGGGQGFTYSDGRWLRGQGIAIGQERLPALGSVSCATPSFCVAQDDLYPFVYSAGRWLRGPETSLYGIASMSCPTRSFCVAVGDDFAATFRASA